MGTVESYCSEKMKESLEITSIVMVGTLKYNHLYLLDKLKAHKA